MFECSGAITRLKYMKEVPGRWKRSEGEEKFRERKDVCVCVCLYAPLVN